jgi:hypothetical protein
MRLCFHLPSPRKSTFARRRAVRPQKGDSKRASGLAPSLGINGPLMCASQRRLVFSSHPMDRSLDLLSVVHEMKDGGRRSG